MIPIQDNPGPRRSMPWVTWGLIIINVAVFLYQVSLGPDAESFMLAYSVVPLAIVNGVPQTSLPGVPPGIPFHTPEPVYLTLITAMFLHAGWLHIGGNMLYLFIFGDNVEDRMGHIPYLLFYLFCGVIASIAQIVVGPQVTIPSLGASGAIAGVLAAYLVLFPWSGVRTLIFIFFFVTIVTLPAVVLIGIWFVIQFFDGITALADVQQGMGGVAYFAHVGGFIVGLVLTLLVRSSLQPPPPISYPFYPRHPNATRTTRWW
ncbi:MAG: rhomboid family intramembrane serine protease [Ktedonobacteraceae bacterium]|nr:rhomboid family intramembrane serine protease [Ktedonobacteraceae bacterium]MBO0792166.1 rhomboid family intramembrane serine protease [Ktedonobacteraceae bacterium]